MAQCASKQRRFYRGANDTVEPAVGSQTRETKNLRVQRIGNTDFLEIMVVETSQHRNRDQQRARYTMFGGRARHRLARRGEHRPATGCMNVQHPHAEAGGGGAGLRDGIGNIVKLEIEKDAKAAVNHPPHRLWPGDHKQFFANFQRARRGIEPIHQRHGVRRIGEVERDNDARVDATHRRFLVSEMLLKGEEP